MALFSDRREEAFFEGDNECQLMTASFNTPSEIQKSLTSHFEVSAKHLCFYIVIFLLHFEKNPAVYY